MKAKVWIALWLTTVLVIAGLLGFCVYKVDPFMHYHKPETDQYFYTLDNQRSQNDGIAKNFDYDAMIIGSSLTENFKTTEMDAIFDCTSIKLPYAGGSYNEINDAIETALTHQPNLKTIVWCMDALRFTDDKDLMREDLGQYPTYLYDNNPFNDIKYLLNRDVIWNRAYAMIDATDSPNFKPGITAFDDYSYWQPWFTFGRTAVLPDGFQEFEPAAPKHLTPEDRAAIEGNIRENVTELASRYPEVDFYYFISPYCITWWESLVRTGNIYKQIEAEQYVIELVLEVENINLFSFNNRYDIITDLNNYKDVLHYGTWVNSLMLKWMHAGEYRLTRDNYRDYLAKEMDFYLSYDYMSLNDQEDYENDNYAFALYNEELTGQKPVSLPLEEKNFALQSAILTEDGFEENPAIECSGQLSRVIDEQYSIEDSLGDGNYLGGETTVTISKDQKFLLFYGRKLADHGQPIVMLFDESGESVAKFSVGYPNIDTQWHQYIIDVSQFSGEAKIVFHGECIGTADPEASSFLFSNIWLY